MLCRLSSQFKIIINGRINSFIEFFTLARKMNTDLLRVCINGNSLAPLELLQPN